MDDVIDIALLREFEEFLDFLPELLDRIEDVVPLDFFLIGGRCGFLGFPLPLLFPVLSDLVLLFVSEGFFLLHFPAN